MKTKPKKRNPRDLNLINLEAQKKRNEKLKKRIGDMKVNFKTILRFFEDVVDERTRRIVTLESEMKMLMGVVFKNKQKGRKS